MSSVRYDQSKKQARSCRNINPEQRNMQTLYQIRIQNLREQKQLRTFCKGLDEQQKIATAEHNKERAAIKRDLARLHRATDRQGKLPMKDVRSYGIKNMDSAMGGSSKKSAKIQELNSTGTSSRGTPKSTPRGSFGERSGVMLDIPRHQMDMSAEEAKLGFQHQDPKQFLDELSEFESPEGESTEYSEMKDDEGDLQDTSFIERWKRLNLLINSMDGNKLRLPVRPMVQRRGSLLEAQHRQSLSRKEQALQPPKPDEKFTAEDAFKVLNTRYLRLTKMNVEEMEQICADEGLNVHDLHTHVDDHKAKTDLMAAVKQGSGSQGSASQRSHSTDTNENASKLRKFLAPDPDSH